MHMHMMEILSQQYIILFRQLGQKLVYAKYQERGIIRRGIYRWQKNRGVASGISTYKHQSLKQVKLVSRTILSSSLLVASLSSASKTSIALLQ